MKLFRSFLDCAGALLLTRAFRLVPAYAPVSAGRMASLAPLNQPSFRTRAGWAFALFLATIPADGASIAITNPSFEANILANPPSGQGDNFIVAAGEGSPITAVPGWTFAATQIDPFTTYGGVSDLGIFNHSSEGLIDNNIVWLYIVQNRRLGTLSVHQTLGETLQLNTRYTLTARVAQAARSEGLPAMPDPVFPVLGDGVSTGDVFARLRVGSTATAMPNFLSAESSASVPANDQWVDWTLVWETGASEALAGQPLVIELFNRANTLGSGLPVEVFFDDIALTAEAIPEPNVASLISLAGLLAFRRPRVR